MNLVKLKFNRTLKLSEKDNYFLIELVTTDRKQSIYLVCDIESYNEIGFILHNNEEYKSEIAILIRSLWEAWNEYGNMSKIVINEIENNEYKAILWDKFVKDYKKISALNAVILSISTGDFLYIEEQLFTQQCINFNENNSRIKLPLNILSMEMLEHTLEIAINTENFEQASAISKEIKKRKLTDNELF